MTIWEFAIARHLAQLLAQAEERVLTDKEAERLKVLIGIVERYEARDLKGEAAAR
jgi:hypothetical protein